MKFTTPDKLPPIIIPKEEVKLGATTPTSPPKNILPLTPPRAPLKPTKKLKIN
jgi:hypothetical protein